MSNHPVNTAGPLAGILIVDMTRVLAGPYATMLLAELGARVIKIEPPGGDDSRRYGPFIEGDSAFFASVNRGKESLALDLKDPADCAIFDRLLKKADVLVENFRPGTMEKLGYGWDELHCRYDRLILASISGYGQTGPYSKLASYDLVAQAIGGIMSVTGEVDGGPVRVGMSIGDIGAGLFAATAINAALVDRERSGTARRIDVSLFDSQISLMENAVMRYSASGDVPRAKGARSPSIAPFDLFETADGPLVICAGNDVLWRKLCEALGLDHLIGREDLASNSGRLAAADLLKTEIDRVVGTAPREVWVRLLDKAGIPNGPVNTIEQALEHPQVQARDMLVEAELPGGRGLRVAGNPMKISGMRIDGARRIVPGFDENRPQILSELGVSSRGSFLGFSGDDRKFAVEDLLPPFLDREVA